MERKIGTIRVKLEISSFRSTLDLINAVSDSASYSFTRDGFSIRTVTQSRSSGKKKSRKAVAGAAEQECTIECTFPAQNLNKYTYSLKASDGTVLPSYEIDVNTSKFQAQIAGIKKGTLDFKIDVYNLNSNPEITIKIPESKGIITIEATKRSKPAKYDNYYNMWYKGSEPKAKPFLHSFNSRITTVKSKGNVCHEMQFVYNTRTQSVTISCYGLSEIAILSEPLDDRMSDSSYEEEHADDPTVTKSLILKDAWISKIHKLSATSVLQVFMDPRADVPLVLRAYIGTQGIATFSIKSDGQNEYIKKLPTPVNATKEKSKPKR